MDDATLVIGSLIEFFPPPRRKKTQGEGERFPFFSPLFFFPPPPRDIKESSRRGPLLPSSHPVTSVSDFFRSERVSIPSINKRRGEEGAIHEIKRRRRRRASNMAVGRWRWDNVNRPVDNPIFLPSRFLFFFSCPSPPSVDNNNHNNSNRGVSLRVTFILSYSERRKEKEANERTAFFFFF